MLAVVPGKSVLAFFASNGIQCTHYGFFPAERFRAFCFNLNLSALGKVIKSRLSDAGFACRNLVSASTRKMHDSVVPDIDSIMSVQPTVHRKDIARLRFVYCFVHGYKIMRVWGKGFAWQAIFKFCLIFPLIVI